MTSSYRPPDASPNAQVFAAGFLVVRQVGVGFELLLMRHADRWDLPKGHLEVGETFREGAARELAEETGLAENDYQVDERFEFRIEYDVMQTRDGGHLRRKEVRIYLALLKDPNQPLKLTEHLGCEWFLYSPELRIQPQTIDPLLAALALHWQQQSPRFH